MTEPTSRSLHGKLAILDYGIGGLDIWRRLRARYPQLDTLYLSDSGFTPYGQLDDVTLSARLSALSHELKARGAQRLIVACNAASSALPSAEMALPTLGMIEAGLRCVRESGLRRVGVIGGGRTIKAGLYGDALRAEGFEVTERVAQALSIHIEAGDLDSPELNAHVESICASLSDREALLLACTHYPALSPQLQRHLPHTRLLDPAHTLVRQVERDWALSAARGQGQSEVFTTGSITKMRRAASLAFQVSLPAQVGILEI